MEGPKGATENPLRGLFPLEEPSLVSIQIRVTPQRSPFVSKKKEKYCCPCEIKKMPMKPLET